jgi:hypothetical protein
LHLLRAQLRTCGVASVHYFFIIEGEGRRFDDDGGMWLPDDHTALAQAKMLIQVIKEDGELDYSGWRVIVQDASGRRVGVVPF